MRRFFLFVLPLAALLVLCTGQAAAGPAPEGGPPSTTAAAGPVHITVPFAPGEVDLSTLGVSPTDLLTVGPIPSLSTPPGNLIVDDDMLDCPNAQYTSIQLAVNAAQPGDKIKVCRGTYMEQVTIPSGKDGLTLYSVPDLQAVIKAPPVMLDPKAIVRVNGAQDVTIRHFTISGPGGGGCDSIRWGVRVDTGGSALITDNHITEIRDLGQSGCQNGIGVLLGRNRPDISPQDVSPGSGTVVHNLIDHYQKGGVLVDNTGSSTGEVAYNEVIGTPSPIIAQNGIQLSRAGRGDAHHNKVSMNQYLPGGVEATGILLYNNSVPARAHHNEVFMNDAGVTLWMVTNNAEISYNNARNNMYGVVAYAPSSNNLIAYNKAFENTVLDCRDDNGTPTANRWVKDLGRTENPPGICKQAGPQ
jgi:parallel beta-helix repeat protein